jgi:hypothetical protein
MRILHACKGVHTLFTGKRKREREREGGRERERDKEREREIKRERERERERERDVEYVENCYFYFLKGMTDALAPFSYLLL